MAASGNNMDKEATEATLRKVCCSRFHGSTKHDVAHKHGHIVRLRPFNIAARVNMAAQQNTKMGIAGSMSNGDASVHVCGPVRLSAMRSCTLHVGILTGSCKHMLFALSFVCECSVAHRSRRTIGFAYEDVLCKCCGGGYSAFVRTCEST